MSRKLQIRFMFSTHVLAFAAVVETLFLVDVTVDDFGADCRNFSQEAHFKKPISRILRANFPYFTYLEVAFLQILKKAKKPFRKLKPPFRKVDEKKLGGFENLF